MANTVEPSIEVEHPSGLEVRYFEEDKPSKTKRHYEVRAHHLREKHLGDCEWRTVPSVTTVQKILHKEALISWAQRTGAQGVAQLFNMHVLQPVGLNGQVVLGFHDPGKGLVVAGEEELIALLKKYRLSTDALKKAGGVRGQSCHDALEAWAKTGLFPNPATYPISEQGYVAALEDFLQESNAEAARYEVVVGSLEYGYAGRFDLDIELPKPVQLQTHWTPAGRGDKLEWFDAGLYRVDLKTAKDVFEEHGEQLEAYEQAAVECGLPASLKRVVLHCSSESKYKFKPSWSVFEDFEATLVKWRLNEARKERKKNG